ncbi:MAG: DNA polymerase Y family protein [Verrucomicrobiota bacterium]|nr:DNA polymerase Y family protein [Verrucomicrobiota bacterium]
MFAVIYIPNFSLQAVLRNEMELFSRPVALIDERERQATVFQMTQTARDAGICEGLTSTQALARCKNVLIKSRSPSQEKIATEIFLQTAYNFSPRIEVTADGVCTLDLQGIKISFDDISATLWSEKVLAALAKVNLRARIGGAQTPHLAWYAARCASPFLLVENAIDFISALPIESLEPAPHILNILQRWGIHTVGAFIILGRDKIAERLGPDGLELFERASVEQIRPLNLMTPSENFFETMEFENEIETLQPLLFVLRRFVEQLCHRLSLRYFSISDLELRLNLSSGEKEDSLFKIPSPTANVEILFRMLHTHLETVRTDSPIVALQLSAKPCRGENHQFGLFEAALRDPNQFSETLARLSALCGAKNIGAPVLENSFRPDAFQMRRPCFETLSTQNSKFQTQNVGLNLRRFRPPFHADVETKNKKPAFLSSLKLNSAIEKTSGPWRASGDWWEQEKLWNRDEWDVQMRNGSLYRIYREDKNWFLEGVYD